MSLGVGALSAAWASLGPWSAYLVPGGGGGNAGPFLHGAKNVALAAKPSHKYVARRTWFGFGCWLLTITCVIIVAIIAIIVIMMIVSIVKINVDGHDDDDGDDDDDDGADQYVSVVSYLGWRGFCCEGQVCVVRVLHWRARLLLRGNSTNHGDGDDDDDEDDDEQ